MLNNDQAPNTAGSMPGAVRNLPAVLLAGVLTMCVQAAMAQPAGAPPGMSPPAGSSSEAPPSGGFGGGMRLSDDPKLLAPLPPPPPDSAPPSPDPRNLQGTYIANAIPGGPMAGPIPPFSPKGMQIMQRQMEMMFKGTPLGGTSARCRPMEAIGVGADLFPAEIVQSKDKMVVLSEEGRSRWVIYLDREHPKQLQPSYWGHSVGHWEGDTLVVDTIGFNGEHTFQSTQSHIVSRLRKVGDGRTIELKVTTVDPEYYSRPHEKVSTAIWHPEVNMLEFQCEENLEGAREGLIIE